MRVCRQSRKRVGAHRSRAGCGRHNVRSLRHDQAKKKSSSSTKKPLRSCCALSPPDGGVGSWRGGSWGRGPIPASLPPPWPGCKTYLILVDASTKTNSLQPGENAPIWSQLPNLGVRLGRAGLEARRKISTIACARANFRPLHQEPAQLLQPGSLAAGPCPLQISTQDRTHANKPRNERTTARTPCPPAYVALRGLLVREVPSASLSPSDSHRTPLHATRSDVGRA